MTENEVKYRSIDSPSKTVFLAEDVHKALKHIAIDEDRPIKEVADKLLREHSEIQRELSR